MEIIINLSDELKYFYFYLLYSKESLDPVVVMLVDSQPENEDDLDYDLLSPRTLGQVIASPDFSNLPLPKQTLIHELFGSKFSGELFLRHIL